MKDHVWAKLEMASHIPLARTQSHGHTYQGKLESVVQLFSATDI